MLANHLIFQRISAPSQLHKHLIINDLCMVFQMPRALEKKDEGKERRKLKSINDCLSMAYNDKNGKAYKVGPRSSWTGPPQGSAGSVQPRAQDRPPAASL